MASIPRILVIDPVGILSDLVRSSMILLDRRCVLVEVPSFDEALSELASSKIQLIVTSFAGSGDMNGLDLAERAIREQAAASVIIVSDETDAPIDPRVLVGKPFQYLTYPPGEQFLRAIRIGLDGEEVVQVEEGSSAAFDIGPIPNVDVKRVRQLLVNTIIETGSMGGMLCDRAGRVLVDEGATGYIDKSVIAASFAPSFPYAVKVAPQIGGTGWSMKYYDGERYDLFALSLGYHHFAVLIFDGTKRGAFGEVTRFGRQGIDQIIELIGPEAWTYEEAILLTAEAKDKADAESDAIMGKRRTSAFTRDEVLEMMNQADQEAESSSELEPVFDPVANLDVDFLMGDDFDSGLDDLFGGDMMDSDTVFDIGGGENVSFDEAQDMGLLGD